MLAHVEQGSARGDHQGDAVIELSSILDSDTKVFETTLDPNSGLLVLGDSKMQREVVTAIRRLEENDIAVPKADLHAEYVPVEGD